MIFKRIKSEGILANSYLVGSGANAFIVDPHRDCEIYLDIAKQENLTINHIFETHRHEDFAIGSIELVHLTQATIYHGPGLRGRTFISEICHVNFSIKYGNTLKTPCSLFMIRENWGSCYFNSHPGSFRAMSNVSTFCPAKKNCAHTNLPSNFAMVHGSVKKISIAPCLF